MEIQRLQREPRPASPSAPMVRRFFLLNASPDLRQQIEAMPLLHPSHGLRHSPIAGVVLTGGDVDAIAGLLVLRERHPFTIWGAAPVMGVLEANPIFEVLGRDLVARRTVGLDRPFALTRPDGSRVRADGGAVRRARQDAALFGAAGRGPADRRRRHDGRGRDRRWPLARVLHPRLRRVARLAGRAAARRRSRVLRRHAVARRRDDRRRHRHQDRAAHGPYEPDRPRRHLRRLRPARGAAQGAHPHQQQQSGPARRLAGAGRAPRRAGWTIAADGMRFEAYAFGPNASRCRAHSRRRAPCAPHRPRSRR